MKRVGIAVVVLILFVIMGFGVYLFEFNDTEYIIKVTDKERVTSVSGSGDSTHAESKYLIWGQDKNKEEYVFENTDSLFRTKFDSSAIYGKLKKGKTYKITAVGYRVPLFSLYKNIIKVEEVESING